MLLNRKNGSTSNIIRVKLLDSSVTTGAGLPGLTSASSGLIISTIADNEASATTYTVAGSTIEAVTTLGTFAAPTSTKVRFKEVDATNHKGVYELQIADARFAVSSARHLLVSILGATNLAQTDFVIDLQADANITYIAGSAVSTSTAQLGVNVVNNAGSAITAASGRQEVNLSHIAGSAVSTSTAQLGVNVVNNAGSAITSASGRQEVNVSHFGGSALTSSAGIPSVNTVQWRGTQPNALTSGRVEVLLGACATAVIDAGAIAADAIGASELAADAVTEIAAGIKALIIETNNSITVGQAMSLILAAVAGVTTSSGNTLKDPSGTTTRIAATVDGSNNRTGMVLTPSS